MNFIESYNKYREYFERFLNAQLIKLRKNTLSIELFGAMEYAMRGGGKRLRPVLYLAVYDFLTNSSLINENKNRLICNTSNGNSAGVNIENISCAIEMLHTSTLIHDDMPCLDNDDFRRGKASCHKMFGEATALLAGDALLNHSFTVLLEASFQSPSLIRAAYEFSVLTGCLGVIGGQSVEIGIMQKLKTKTGYDMFCNDAGQSEKIKTKQSFELNQSKKNTSETIQESYLTDTVTKEDFINIYKNKTGALFAGVMQLAASSAGREDLNPILKDYADNFGLAFQLKDDMNDNNKESFTYFFGKRETRNLIDCYTENARKSAMLLNCEFLLKMVDFEKYI